MEIKYGVFSCDSHAQVHKDAFTKRMSRAKFGDRIPQVIETTDPAHMHWPSDRPVHRWAVANQVVDTRAPANCPALWNDPRRLKSPERWEEVPPAAYDPVERLKMLDADGVDGEVLFPNPPVQNVPFLQSDAEFELACVQAYNDAMAEWFQTSDRYIPLALVPLLCDIETTVVEVERVAKLGYRGIMMVAEPSSVMGIPDASRSDPLKAMVISNPALKNLKHFCDARWEPLWAACQDLGLVINWHANAAINLPVPIWKEYEQGQWRAANLASTHATLGQFIPHLVLSGNLERYPRLQWVCAETGMAWMSAVMDICDHIWERNHLWTEGIETRPSDQVRRQVHLSLWYEHQGLKMRHKIGLENIMWMTDTPHNVSTYPNTRAAVARVMAGIPADEQKKLLYENALRLYHLE